MAKKFLPYTGVDDGELRLHAYQEEHIQLLLNEPTKSALIGSVMGTGKTAVALEFATRMEWERVLIVGVKDTYEQFEERIAAQSDHRHQLLRIDGSQPGRWNFQAMLSGQPGWFFVGSEFLTRQDWETIPIFNEDGSPKMVVDKKTNEPTDKQEAIAHQLGTYKKLKLDALIFDEVHKVANRKGNGSRTLKTIKPDWKVAMSGTFYGNKFENVHSVTRWLWPDLIDPNFHRWKSQWCTMKTIHVQGGKEREIVQGERDPGEFVKTLPCYIRAEAEEQPPAPEVIFVDLTEKQREQYDDLERDLLVWLKSHRGLEPLVADLPITLRSRLRTATLGEMSLDEKGDITFALDCESSKLRALRGILDFWKDEPVAIYTDSKVFAKVTVARLRAAGYNAVEWSGDVTSSQRRKIKAAFLAGEVQYIVAVITAFSTGLDGFQKVCSKIVWLSESENQMQNAQAVARFFRPGRVGEFAQVKILARNTHDVGIYSRLIAQQLNVNETLRLAA